VSYKIVVCNGLYRAGSTWQYNVVRELLERAGTGYGVGVFPPSIRRLKARARSKKPGIQVIKMHGYIEGLEELLQSGAAKLCTIYRDVRDIYLSWKRYKPDRPEQIFLDFMSDGVRSHLAYRTQPNTICLKYEGVMEDTVRGVAVMAQFLGVVLDSDEYSEIDEVCSVQRAKEIADNQVPGGADKKTVIQCDHVSDTMGASCWDTLLSPFDAERVTKQFRDWLVQFGYEVEE